MSESPAVELCTYILLVQLPRLGKHFLCGGHQMKDTSERKGNAKE